MTNLLNITEQQYQELKEALIEAKRQGLEKFELSEQPIITKFAEYWLEAVENKRKQEGKRIYDPKKHKKKCPNCSYEWISRIDHVKLCPKCKNRIKS